MRAKKLARFTKWVWTYTVGNFAFYLERMVG